MVSFKHLTLGLLGTAFLLSTNPVSAKLDNWQQMLEEDHNRGSLAQTCLYGYRDAASSKDEASQKIWAKRFRVLRRENENEPLSPEEIALLHTLEKVDVKPSDLPGTPYSMMKPGTFSRHMRTFKVTSIA